MPILACTWFAIVYLMPAVKVKISYWRGGMTEVKRYYVGINTKCLGGIGLVEMTDLYRETTGFDGLVMGKDYDMLKAENESLRKDADRYRWLMSEAVYNGTLGIRDGWIDFEFKDEAQSQIDAAISSPENP